MEMGFDAVLLNSAVALAMDPSLWLLGLQKRLKEGVWAMRGE